jgi:GGDEF domain-containing protein
MRLFVISALVIAFLAILFALQNNSLVTINLFIWRYQQSLAVVLLATLAIGVLVGLLVSVPAIIRGGWRRSRIQRQADELATALQSREAEIDSQIQKAETVRSGYLDLLEALEVTEPVTGLLHQQLVSQAAQSLVKRMQTRLSDPAYRSVMLLTMQAAVAQPALTQSPGQVGQVWAALAQVLRQQTSPETWLYSDGSGRFLCTAHGLDEAAATRFGERLQRHLLEQPLHLPDGTQVPIEVSMGAAIASRETPTSAETLLNTAHTALDQAQQRGKNRFRLLTANPV